MPISSIEIQTLSIPFKTSFKHSSAERKVTQSILVIARSDSNSGFGEGCPREYVTQESLESALHFFRENQSDFLNLDNLKKIKTWVESNEGLIDKNPAAWCAVELALLDLLSKDQFKSIEEFLDLPELNKDFNYSAILGDSTLEVTKGQIEQFAKFGLNDFKLKITGNSGIDNQKLKLIRDKIPDCTIRIDANNFWKSAKDSFDYFEQLAFPIVGIEEPLTPFDIKGMIELYNKFNVPIILDESFLNINHFEKIVSNTDAFILNLRVSKMGGIIRSLQIAKKASELNIPLIVGAQVGETSILTRSALTIVNAYRSTVLFQEGAFGTLLLTNDIVRKPLMFGQFGKLNPSEMLTKTEFGFQMEYDL